MIRKFKKPIPVRSLIALVTGLLFVTGTGVFGQVERADVDHAFVQGLVAERAKGKYKPHASQTPKFLRQLSYDDYFKIQFIGDQSLWREDNLPFRAQFFHPGYIHSDTVTLNEFTDTHVQRLPFLRTSFNYHDLELKGRLPGSLEYAGFRLLHPLNQPEVWDEVVSFLGASYFRALGQGHRYGISARGLALNAGGPEPEEFPTFVEFWLGKPAADATSATIHALLDSPSVAGAYTFVLTPGAETIVDVHATLFFRQAVDHAGFAPLTSMFWFGENSHGRYGDFRPEVHDSDGLLIAPDADTRWWRPLKNPTQPRLTFFDITTLVGFGLLQRDRDYGNFEDLEGRYEHRPSVWIEPRNSWGAGRVVLFEMPTTDEFHDNVVAYWAPSEKPAIGVPIDLEWRMRWTDLPVFGGPSGWVRATRQTEHDGSPRRTMFVIDFASAGLEAIPASADVKAEVTVPGATVVGQTVRRSEIDGSWRLTLRLEGAGEKPTPVEVRARLLLEGKPITETWVNTWNPTP